MKLILTLVAASLLALPATAAPCRDAKGKFIKCSPAASAPAKRCRDAKGKFTKCPK